MTAIQRSMLAALKDGPKLPKTIAERTGQPVPIVTTSLIGLRKKRLVERDPKGFYALTEEGRDALL